MIKAIRVKIPIDKPEETLKLSDLIIEKDTADGVDSSLAGVIDMAAFALKVTAAKDKRKEADKKAGTAQKKYELAANKCGLGKGQIKGEKKTVVWYVRQVRDLLLVIHDGNEETLSEYGFNVVITTTGARKNIRVDIPTKPEDMVDLAEDIVEQHTTLGVGSPLTPALIDMAAFETLVDDTATLVHDWGVLRGSVETLNEQALVIIGYAPAQTSNTSDTIYHELTRIRTRLLQKFQGEEQALEEFGFDVVTTEYKPGKKGDSANFSVKGKVTNSATNAPLGNSLVYITELDLFVTADADGNYAFPKQTAGTYNMLAHKTGFQNSAITPVTITAGQVSTVNFQLTPQSGGGSGTISGTVTNGGSPYQANLTVVAGASTITTHTNLSGGFVMTGVPAGAQVISCVPEDNPANIKTNNITVDPDETTTSNFVYP